MTTRATASDLSAAIEPGSLPHGSRATLEAGLSSAVPSGGPSPAPGAGISGLTPDNVEDPLSALISGELNPGGGDSPLTSGLSVGPGPSPLGSQQADPVKIRLQTLASNAKSPLIAAQARNELRRLVREAV